jgi:hypothetical protein
MRSKSFILPYLNPLLLEAKLPAVINKNTSIHF